MFTVNILKEKVNRSREAGNSTKESKFSKPCIKFGHVNARSLYPKLDEINDVVVKHDFDVFCVSETWLGERFKGKDVGIPDYNIYRKDRVEALGGGVCIYIKNHLTVKVRKDLMFDEIEAVWLELNEGDKICCLISCIYRPPSSSQAYYSKVVDMYERAQLDDIPIISMGDLNYDYKLDESLSNNPIHYIEMAYEMTQLIFQPTRETSDTSTTLDIILVSHPGLHKSSGVVKYNFSDHYLVYTEFEFNVINQKGSKHNFVKFRDMKRFNTENVLNDLNSCEVLNGSLYDEDISWEKWKLMFNEICNKNAPIKIARFKKRSNPWITPDVVKLLYKRDHVHAKAVRTKSDILFDQYRSLRNQVTKVIKENKHKYYNEINSLCATDPKKMWSEIKKLVSSKARSNPMNCDISPDRFNSHFINITKNLDCNFKNKHVKFLWKGPKSRYVFKFHHISSQDIQLYLNSMTNKHGNYVLGMDIKLLKIACPVISKSLAYVVNSSLDNGIVHDDWKKARVTPVYKNEGEINDENNFRPISVISHIAKMIESFVSDQIIKYLEDHAFISIDQSAYLKRHSTQTCLHRVIDDWLEQIHDNSLTGACFFRYLQMFWFYKSWNLTEKARNVRDNR